MFNPFEPYEAKYLTGFTKKGVEAFVLQSYPRGERPFEDPRLPGYLLTHYEEIKLAENHMDSIEHDPKKRLLMIDNPDDWNELIRLGRPGSGAHVYMRFKIPDADKKAKKVLEKHIRAYIDHKLGWRIPGYDVVQFSLDAIFGDLYAVLKYGPKYCKVKLDDIESNKGYVL
ncbi:MAG TPA: hypothetical protein VHM26_07630 [Chitinophagaceae bacterium]|jgi:hypothetical protein|nr:hypothetical protein [Chitinophagaceae bacterium]